MPLCVQGFIWRGLRANEDGMSLLNIFLRLASSELAKDGMFCDDSAGHLHGFIEPQLCFMAERVG